MRDACPSPSRTENSAVQHIHFNKMEWIEIKRNDNVELN